MAGIFFWRSEKEVKDSEKTKIRDRRPNIIDLSESYSANSALTKGLYHNTYPGFKYAGSLAFPIISVPVFFMGLPTPEHESDMVNKQIKELVEKFQSEMQQIHIQCHREGTIWVWPKYDRSSRRIVWEFIPDDSVVDVIRDISSNEIISIWTDEQITISTDYNERKTIRRIRQFTEAAVTVRYEGDYIPDQLADSTMRNPSGILPVPFSNNVDAGDVRGHSDYERLIADFKAYNDVSKAELEILAQFRPKLNLQVQDVDKWLENNGYSSLSEIDVSSADLFFTMYGKEGVSLIESSRLTDGHRAALERIFIKMVESSAVPEIVWGPSVTGNYASSADAMTTLVKYVKDKQTQKNESYTRLWNGTLSLASQVAIGSFKGTVKMKWNDLDSVSDETKVKIFQQFAAGVAQLISSAGATLEQIHLLWKAQFPKATPEQFEEFAKGLDGTAKHKQFANATYSDALGMSGNGEQDEIDKMLKDEQATDRAQNQNK